MHAGYKEDCASGKAIAISMATRSEAIVIDSDEYNSDEQLGEDTRSTGDLETNSLELEIPMDIGASVASISDSLRIQYAPYGNANVPIVDILENLLIECMSEIVLFGEGDFTFSVAIAALRGQSWDGIISTSYEARDTEPEFNLVKLKCVQNCAYINGEEFMRSGEIEPETILGNIQAVLNLRQPPEGAWQFRIDATNIPNELTIRKKVVWFQCPWLPGTGNEERNDIERRFKLLRKFLQQMCCRQSQNDYVLIGIANTDPYIQGYGLHKLLGDRLSSADCYGYNFLGADTTLIKKILQFGYKHQSVVPHRKIHKKILHHHATLVFKKN